MTIEELARRTGMTVRNIRAHQTRGLLPAPVVRARTGYYGPEHAARLELIKEMQAAGFNLTAIGHVLDMAPAGGGEELLRLERMLMAPWEEEEPEVVSVDDLSRRFGGIDPRTVQRVVDLGLLRDLGDGTFEVPSPSLLQAGEDVVSLGIPLDHAVAVVEKVQRHAKGVAREFVRLFVQDVWRPFKEAGMPQEQLPAIRKSLEKLRSLSSDVVMGTFRLKMAAETEAAFGKELERPLTKRGRRAS